MPFGKNKKKSGSDGTELEVMDRAENDKSEVKVKSLNPFSRIRKKFRLILKKKPHEHADSDDLFGNPSGAGMSDDDHSGGKKSKAKKPKKEKKPSEKKAKKNKSSDDAEDGGNEKKSGLPIWIFIVVGALVLGAAAFFIVKFVANQPTVEQQLLDAKVLATSQEYLEAGKIYDKLIKKDKTLVEAYLGLADVLVATGMSDIAQKGLTDALEPTKNDARIQAKIDELSFSAELQSPDETKESNDDSVESEDDSDDSVATSGTTADTVSFSDPTFEKMIRIALKKDDFAQFTASELASVTSLKILGNTHASASVGDAAAGIDASLPSSNWADGYEIDGTMYTERGMIKNLNDLKYFTGLKKLVVAYNVVFDINGVSELTGIETLGLYCNDIVDISPVASLTTLKYLYIYNNYIRDVSPLAGLTELQQLWLNRNNIVDISPLKSLTRLNELYLNDNQIKDISAVASLDKLTFFYIANNQVTDISAVKNLPMLTDISFEGNPITDASPAAHVRFKNRPFF